MKILIFGDVYGRIGRKAIAKDIPKLREKYAADGVIVNIENITSGRGPVKEHAQFVEDLGVNLMTLGDHSFDNIENFEEYLRDEHANIIRPANFYSDDSFSIPGNGYKIIEIAGKKILCIQLLGEAFMSHKVENPFVTVKNILQSIPESSYDYSIVEFHRETTAEIAGMKYFLTELHTKNILLYGTHTHVQTSDAHIFGDMGYITDVGMNGPSRGVIGAEYASVKKRFISGIQRGKIEQNLEKFYQINAICVTLDTETGSCVDIETIFYQSEL